MRAMLKMRSFFCVVFVPHITADLPCHFLIRVYCRVEAEKQTLERVHLKCSVKKKMWTSITHIMQSLLVTIWMHSV